MGGLKLLLIEKNFVFYVARHTAAETSGLEFDKETVSRYNRLTAFHEFQVERGFHIIADPKLAAVGLAADFSDQLVQARRLSFVKIETAAE